MSSNASHARSCWTIALLAMLLFAPPACSDGHAQPTEAEAAPGARDSALRHDAVKRIRELRSDFLTRELELDAGQKLALESLLEAHDKLRLRTHQQTQQSRRALQQAIERAEIERLDELTQAFRAAFRARDEARLLPDEADLSFLSSTQRAKLNLLLPRFERRVEKRIRAAIDDPMSGPGKGAGKGKRQGGGMGPNAPDRGRGQGKGQQRGR